MNHGRHNLPEQTPFDVFYTPNVEGGDAYATTANYGLWMLE